MEGTMEKQRTEVVARNWYQSVILTVGAGEAHLHKKKSDFGFIAGDPDVRC